MGLQKWVNPYVESGVGDKVGAGAAQEAEGSLQPCRQGPWWRCPFHTCSWAEVAYLGSPGDKESREGWKEGAVSRAGDNESREGWKEGAVSSKFSCRWMLSTFVAVHQEMWPLLPMSPIRNFVSSIRRHPYIPALVQEGQGKNE